MLDSCPPTPSRAPSPQAHLAEHPQGDSPPPTPLTARIGIWHEQVTSAHQGDVSKLVTHLSPFQIVEQEKATKETAMEQPTVFATTGLNAGSANTITVTFPAHLGVAWNVQIAPALPPPHDCGEEYRAKIRSRIKMEKHISSLATPPRSIELSPTVRSLSPTQSVGDAPISPLKFTVDDAIPTSLLVENGLDFPDAPNDEQLDEPTLPIIPPPRYTADDVYVVEALGELASGVRPVNIQVDAPTTSENDPNLALVQYEDDAARAAAILIAMRHPPPPPSSATSSAPSSARSSSPPSEPARSKRKVAQPDEPAKKRKVSFDKPSGSGAAKGKENVPPKLKFTRPSPATPTDVEADERTHNPENPVHIPVPRRVVEGADNGKVIKIIHAMRAYDWTKARGILSFCRTYDEIDHMKLDRFIKGKYRRVFEKYVPELKRFRRPSRATNFVGRVRV